MAKSGIEISLADAAELLGLSKRRIQAIVRDGTGRLPIARTISLGAMKIHMVRMSDVTKYRKYVRGEAGRPPKEKT